MAGGAASRVLFVFLLLALAQAIKPLHPHIVFVLADDYGYADISYHARRYPNTSNTSAVPKNIIETPHLDALAASGVKLENYYIQPVCSPTRAALMTGRYAPRTGVHVPFIDSSPNVLPNDEVLLPQLLRKAGYATHAVGKWHLGFKTWSHTPTERGFDSWFGYYGGSTDYFRIESLCWPGRFVHQDGCFSSTNNGEPVTGCDLHRHTTTSREDICNSTEYSTMLFTKEAEAIIAEHGSKKDEQPLFLYLAHQAVHVGNKPTPQHTDYWLDQAPARYIEPYAWVTDSKRRNLSAMVSVLDESVGNLTAALKQAKMWDNTLFVFSTDNGGPVGAGASNYPFRKGKGSCYEGGVKGIGFVTGGAHSGLVQMGGYENRALMHITDWLPTLCEVAGCPGGAVPTGTKPLDGVSAWAAISRNGSTTRTEILHDTSETHDSPALRLGHFKLVGGALFNLAKDPTEGHDLAKDPAHQATLKQLQARIAHFKSTDMRCDELTPDPASNPQHFGGVWTPWSNDTRPGCPPYVPPIPPAPPGDCDSAHFLEDTDFRDGNGIAHLANVISAQDCCALCATQWAAKGCKFFTVVTNGTRGRGCWLKADDHGKVHEMGATSGAVSSSMI